MDKRNNITNFTAINYGGGQLRWLRGPRLGPATARLLELRFRIPPVAWVSVSFECSVLSGTGLCVGLIILPGDSYCVVSECDSEA